MPSTVLEYIRDGMLIVYLGTPEELLFTIAYQDVTNENLFNFSYMGAKYFIDMNDVDNIKAFEDNEFENDELVDMPFGKVCNLKTVYPETFFLCFTDIHDITNGSIYEHNWKKGFA